MVNIPFGKFFDTQTDHDLISSLELLKTDEINYDDKVYLFRSTLTNDYYVVLETDTDWTFTAEWAREALSDQTIELEEIPPKSSDYPGQYYVYRVFHR